MFCFSLMHMQCSLLDAFWVAFFIKGMLKQTCFDTCAMDPYHLDRVWKNADPLLYCSGLRYSICYTCYNVVVHCQIKKLLKSNWFSSGLKTLFQGLSLFSNNVQKNSLPWSFETFIPLGKFLALHHWPLATWVLEEAWNPHYSPHKRALRESPIQCNPEVESPKVRL